VLIGVLHIGNAEHEFPILTRTEAVKDFEVTALALSTTLTFYWTIPALLFASRAAFPLPLALYLKPLLRFRDRALLRDDGDQEPTFGSQGDLQSELREVQALLLSRDALKVLSQNQWPSSSSWLESAMFGAIHFFQPYKWGHYQSRSLLVLLGFASFTIVALPIFMSHAVSRSFVWVFGSQ
jgi:hypothetical protein